MRLHYLFALAALVVMAGTASADVSYQYVTDLVGNGGTYNAATGQTDVTVNLYLQETLTSGSSSIVNNFTETTGSGKSAVTTTGLGAFGVQMTASTASGSLISYDNSAGVATNVWGSGALQGYNPNASGNYQQFTMIGAVAIGNNTGPKVDGSGKVLLGSFDVVVAAGTSTTFTISSATSVYGDSTFTNGQTTNGTLNLDANGSATSFSSNESWTGANNPVDGNFSFTVAGAAVPEPSSLALCGFLVCGGAYTGYRRRKAALNAAAVEATVAV